MARTCSIRRAAWATAPWAVDASLGALIGTGRVRPTIVVGIDNTGPGRWRDYAPAVAVAALPERLKALVEDTGGGPPVSDGYVRFLVEELKPQIDKMLRTRPDVASTVLCGSSLGGLITAYAGYTRPDVFGLLGELSPSSWWNNDVIVGDIMKTGPAPMRPLRVYVDSGQGSADDEADTDLLAAAYVALGYKDGVNFRHVIQPGASHNETYWAQRFPGAMQLLLGAR